VAGKPAKRWSRTGRPAKRWSMMGKPARKRRVNLPKDKSWRTGLPEKGGQAGSGMAMPSAPEDAVSAR